jgi:hypothetical protein
LSVELMHVKSILYLQNTLKSILYFTIKILCLKVFCI